MNKSALIVGLNIILCAIILLYYGNKAKEKLPGWLPHKKFIYLCMIAIICGAFVAFGGYFFNLGFSNR